MIAERFNGQTADPVVPFTTERSVVLGSVLDDGKRAAVLCGFDSGIGFLIFTVSYDMCFRSARFRKLWTTM